MRGILVLALVAAVRGVDGAGECGATPPDRMALKLAPCASAAQDPSSAPSSSCCNAVHSIGKQSPKGLCAVMLSKTAKSAGIKAEVAITIPKRCNLVDRPIGYKFRPRMDVKSTNTGFLSTTSEYEGRRVVERAVADRRAAHVPYRTHSMLASPAPLPGRSPRL